MWRTIERFSERRWCPPWLRHEHVNRYLWARRFSRGRVVVDAACGDGYGAAMIAREGAACVYGFDISAEAVREAHDRFACDAGVRFSKADVTNLPLPDNHVDVYLSFETIEHVADDQMLVAEAVRVVKPGGTFVCSTPNRIVVNPGTSLHDPPGNRYHIREYALDEFDAVLRTEFSSIEWYGQTFLPRQYCRVLTALGRMHRGTARRLHQGQKVCGLLWRRAQAHYPVRLRHHWMPEVYIAVGTAPAK
jgi:ubiquinone/menaquinone biosynthesis C-methylase UbiE